eukprot:4240392-Amphidinium_carterae.5
MPSRPWSSSKQPANKQQEQQQAMFNVSVPSFCWHGKAHDVEISSKLQRRISLNQCIFLSSSHCALVAFVLNATCV